MNQNQNNEKPKSPTRPHRPSCSVSRSLVLVVSSLAFLLLLCTSQVEAQGLEAATLFPLTGANALDGAIQEAMVRKAIAYYNARATEIIPNYNFQLSIKSRDTASTVSGALSAASTIGISTFVISSQYREVAEAVAPVVEHGDIIHYTFSSSEALKSYKTVTQMVASERHQGAALAELIVRFNWQFTVAVLSSSSPYGSEVLSEFVSRSSEIGVNILSSQQFYPGTQELWQVMQTTKNSLARVITNFMDPIDMRTVIRFADRLDMLTDKYIWLCSDACANQGIFRDPETGIVDEHLRNKFTGMIGVQYQTGHGKEYEDFLDEWEKEDPFMFPGAGKRSTSHYAPYAYDTIMLHMRSLAFCIANFPGKAKGVQLVSSCHTNATFQGLTGLVKMDVTGHERLAIFDIVNLRRDSLKADYLGFVKIGTWEQGSSFNEMQLDNNLQELDRRFNFVFKPQFHDGSYEFPDLDVRNSFKYWSCNDRKEKTDETGKSVRLEKPDGQGANNIDIDYRCDEFIDCYNMSDEWGCAVSFPALFIVYGIILFLCICLGVFCLIFTCVFGFCIRRKRIRASSPTFLIIICLAVIMGYGGLFAFFGQPHTVSCNFRIWLLAVAVITTISALFVKSFRVWRLYRSPTEIKALKDWQLIIFVVISVIPVIAILALWTGLATPTAMLLEASKDNRDHLMCSYGSVAEMIGFYFFFFAIVAYVALFLLFGIFLSIATRNVVSTFNESRLIAISIYNITFSAIVTIPIVFVLKDSDPLITWIIIVTAFGYGFTATLLLQFFPKVWGIVIRDKFSKDPSTQSGGSSGPTHATVTSKDSKAIF